MNIAHLKLFVRIAATNNISLAGHELGISPAVASAHMNKLEEVLGTKLLHRTTRKVSLTQEGIAFLPHAEDVLTSVEMARASVGTGSLTPQGTLRVTASASFGRMHIVPALKGFLAKNPELAIDLRLSDSIVDMVEGGFDIAIRIAELNDSNLVARKLAGDNRIICTSPEYIKQFGEPQTPKDLLNHKCINLTGIDAWTFNTVNGQERINCNGPLRTDNGESVRDASVAGMGITICSTWIAYQHIQDGKLIQILKNHPLVSNTAIWAVYPSSRLLAPKVRAFIDFFTDYFGQNPYWEQCTKA